MKSFRIYMPGGREVSGAGLIVVALAAIAMIAMIVCVLYLEEFARLIPGLTTSQAKYLLIAVGLIVVGCGWVVLRVAGVPFTKKEADPATRDNAAQRPS